MFDIKTDIQDWVDYIKEIIPLGHGHYNIIAEQSVCNITMRITFFNVVFATRKLIRKMSSSNVNINQDMTMIVYGRDNTLYTIQFLTTNSKGE